MSSKWAFNVYHVSLWNNLSFSEEEGTRLFFLFRHTSLALDELPKHKVSLKFCSTRVRAL